MKKYKIFAIVMLFMYIASFSVIVRAEENQDDSNDYVTECYYIKNDGTIAANGDYVQVETNLISEEQGQSRTSTKAFAYEYTAILNGQYVCKYVHDIQFNYGIPSSLGMIAEIIRSNVFISYAYSTSDYYASGITKAIDNNKNPAVLTSYVTVRRKATGAIDGTIVTKTKCYATGNYE